jgi:hypothetical protein
MKRSLPWLPLILSLLLLPLSSCEMIGDIFKAGAYMGIIAVIILVLLVLWIVNKFRRRR